MSALSLVGAQHAGIGGLKLAFYSATGIGLCFVLRILERYQVRLLVKTVALSGVVAGGYGVIGFVLGHDPLWCPFYADPHMPMGEGAVGTIGNPIVFGAYLTMVLPTLVGWSGETPTTVSRLLRGAALIVATAMVATLSRTSWMCLTVIGAWWVFGRRHYVAVRGAGDLVIRAMAILMVVMVMKSVLPSSAGRLADGTLRRYVTLLAGDGNVQYRLDQYGTVGRILLEKPLTGLGFGTFTRHFREYSRSEHAMDPATGGAHTTDNMYLMIAAETGILGVVSFAAVLSALGHILVKGMQADPLEAGVAAGLFTFLVSVVFWDGLNHPATRIIFWTLTGALNRLHHDRRPVGHTVPTSNRGTGQADLRIRK